MKCNAGPVLSVSSGAALGPKRHTPMVSVLARIIGSFPLGPRTGFELPEPHRYFHALRTYQRHWVLSGKNETGLSPSKSTGMRRLWPVAFKALHWSVGALQIITASP